MCSFLIDAVEFSSICYNIKNETEANAGFGKSVCSEWCWPDPTKRCGKSNLIDYEMGKMRGHGWGMEHRRPKREVHEEEVRKALDKMKSVKACAPSEVAVTFVKALWLGGVKWMVELIRKVWSKEKIPHDWRKSIIIWIFKTQRGHLIDCGNYRWIKLIEHALNILDRVLDRRVRETVKIAEIAHS